MKCFKLAAAAVVFTVIPVLAQAQDGQFFVNGSAGQSNYSVSGWSGGHRDNTDTQGALRFGYLWHAGALDYGVETGYARLGEVTQHGSYSYLDPNGSPAQFNYRQSLSTKGWLLGGNLKYNFGSSWYLSARGGWFRAKTTGTVDSAGFSGARYSQTDTRGYVGLGAGYNFSKSWSVGVGYDYYDLGGRYSDAHVNAYSATAEFRF